MEAHNSCRRRGYISSVASFSIRDWSQLAEHGRVGGLAAIVSTGTSGRISYESNSKPRYTRSVWDLLAAIVIRKIDESAADGRKLPCGPECSPDPGSAK